MLILIDLPDSELNNSDPGFSNIDVVMTAVANGKILPTDRGRMVAINDVVKFLSDRYNIKYEKIEKILSKVPSIQQQSLQK